MEEKMTKNIKNEINFSFTPSSKLDKIKNINKRRKAKIEELSKQICSSIKKNKI